MPDPLKALFDDFYLSVSAWCRQSPESRPGKLGEHYDAMISAANAAVAIVDRLNVDGRWRHDLRDKVINWFNDGFLLVHPASVRRLPPTTQDMANWGGCGVALERETAYAARPESELLRGTVRNPRRRRTPVQRGPLKLTKQEQRAGELLAGGHSQKQIAGEMKVTTGRVSQLVTGFRTKTRAMLTAAQTRQSVQAHKLPESKDGKSFV